MTGISLYDARAEHAVNQVADKAWSMFNQLRTEDPLKPIDVRAICLWSAQDVAPLASEDDHRGLARAAAVVIQHALALDRMVAAVRGRAA